MAKIITMHSPIPKVGQTTVANLLGTALAEKDKYVLLIEMSNMTGYSVILNKSIDRVFSSLKTALINPTRTPNNLLKSIHNNNFYYLANNYENTIAEISEINILNIDKVVKQVANTFDYIIIDLPSNPFDEATKHLLSKTMLVVNHHIEVIDENIMSVKALNECANIFAGYQYDDNVKLQTTVVVNKSLGRYSKLYEGHFKNIPFLEIKNIVDIPLVTEYTYLCNEGNLLNLGKTAEAKELVTSIKILKKIIEKNAKSVGMITTRDVNQTSVQKKSKVSLFGSKAKKEKKPKKQKAKPVKKTEEVKEIEIINLED